MKLTRLFFVLILIGSAFAACDSPEKDPVYLKATHLYFADYSGKKIGVMDINVPNEFTVLADATDGLDTIAGIAIDFTAKKIYAVEETNNRVLRINLDGSGAPEVLYDETGTDSVSSPTAVAIDAITNSLYWANSGTGQLKKATLDGSAVPVSMYGYTKDAIRYSYGLAVAKRLNQLIFSDLHTRSYLLRGNLDGTGFIGAAISGSELTMQNPSGVFFDQQTNVFYWADEGLGKIVANTGGTSIVIFDREDGVTRPDGIAVDRGNSKIYWTETMDEDHYRIVRGNLDGTGTPETILEGVESYSIVLRFEGE